MGCAAQSRGRAHARPGGAERALTFSSVRIRMDVKQGALVGAILGSAVVAVDATAVNVALPAIADDLGGGLAGQQWVANAYLLTLSAFILVSGSLADLYGE